MFAFAGLLESWKSKATGERLYTYTIVTTDPNEVVAHLHNRMPVILSPKDYDRWLARSISPTYPSISSDHFRPT